MSNSGYKVSVIVPVYNKIEYIGDCLDSIIAQSLKDIEIICVDDGSTDGSLGYLLDYSRRAPQVKVISQVNQGVGKARNVGIDESSGEYIAFMDPDDFYPDNNVLRDLYESAVDHEVSVCGGSFSSLKNGTIITKYGGLNSRYVFSEEGLVSYSDYQFDYGFQRFIYSSELFKNGMNRFPNYIRFQDPPFFVKIMNSINTFYCVNRPTYRYREAYKEVGWNLVKKIDMLNGMDDIILYSKEHDLFQLHELEYGRLTSSHTFNIMVSGNDRFERKVVRDKLEMILAHLFDYIDKKPLLDMISSLGESCYRSDGQPDVTVVVPVYNVENYLSDCLNSLINQEGVCSIQIICVDDGSTDSSGKMCDDYSGKDKRIQVIHKENGGLSSARNAGAELAQGRYIYFLDSDDMLRPNSLESMVRLMDQNNLEILFFDALTFFDPPELEVSNSSFKTYYMNRSTQSYTVMHGIDLMADFIQNNTYRTPVQLCMLNHDFYKNRGLNCKDGILHEDNLFTFICYLEAERVMYVNEGYYLRRIRENSIMTSGKSFKNYYGYLKCIECAEQYLYSNGLMESSCGTSVIQSMMQTMDYVYNSLDFKNRNNRMTMNLGEKIVAAECDSSCHFDEPSVVAVVNTDKSGEGFIHSLKTQSIVPQLYCIGSNQCPDCINVNGIDELPIFNNCIYVFLDGDGVVDRNHISKCLLAFKKSNDLLMVSEDSGSVKTTVCTLPQIDLVVQMNSGINIRPNGDYVHSANYIRKEKKSLLQYLHKYLM